MKISELIRKLNAAKKEYGDIKCVVDCFDGLSSKIELNYGQQGKLSNIKKTLKPMELQNSLVMPQQAQMRQRLSLCLLVLKTLTL